jgi:hypothetical protein
MIMYEAKGDHNQLSYAKYLLIPRIPSGSTEYILNDDGSFLPGKNVKSPGQSLSDQTKGPLGLILSVIILSGISLAIRKKTTSVELSFPEVFGCSTLLAMASVVLSKAMFHTAVPGFLSLTIFGAVAWAYFLLDNFSFNRLHALLHAVLPKPAIPRRLGVLRATLITVIGLSIIWSLLMSVVVVPDDWDAWAIWGAKAKVLALGVGPLSDVTFFGHPDYPLLWPSIWAYSGWLSGGWEEMWSRGWGTVFFLLCVWEVVVILKRISTSYDLGILGGALFATIPMAALVASWSYAEAPFWLLSTACAGCILLCSESDEAFTPVVFIAALLAVSAAYTKNEGILFALLTSVWILILPGKKRIARFFLFSMVFLCLYIPWIYWTKIILALSSHAISGLHLDFDNIGRVIHRVIPAIEKISQMWLDIRQWNIVLAGVGVVSVLSLKQSTSRRQIVLPIMIIAGYFIITVFHDAEIYWQVGTSWNRLTLHAMPLLIVFSVHYVSKLLIIKKV